MKNNRVTRKIENESIIAGIIISYQPNIDDLYSSVQNLKEEVDLIILVENGSDKDTQIKIKNSIKDQKIEILIQEENKGLGFAQNLGIQHGLKKGVEYFLFLDDDSTLTKGSSKQLIWALKSNPNLGIAACNIIHKDSNKIQKYWIRTKFFYKRIDFSKKEEKFQNVNTVISSGSMIPRRVIEQCGLFREDYFIDYIDIEYCLRIRSNGYTISVIRNAELIHRLGNTKSIQIGRLLEIHPTFHNPSRRFFMIRNRIWTWKTYMLSFPGWFLIDFSNFIFDNMRVLLFENNKFQNLIQIFKGLKEGFFKREKN